MLPRQQHVLNALATCAGICDQYAASALLDPASTPYQRSYRLSRDCADVCRLTAALVAREAEHMPQLLRTCAELCQACAAACAQFDTLPHRLCAEACRRCEDACRAALV